MGGLAGCMGGDGGGDGGSSGGNSGGGSGGSETSASDEGGSQESVTVDFMSATAAEGPKYKPFFEKSMKNFEKKHSNIKVNMQLVSYGDMQQKLNTSVGGGNPPDLAEGGSSALPFFYSGKVVKHDPYLEESDLVENWDQFMKDTAQFRGEYWSGGGARATSPMLAIRPKFFKGIIDDPHEDLKTWTDFRRALDKVQEKHPNVWAYEANATKFDLEYFWGEARTAYTDGEDPFIEGDPKDPTVKVTNDRTAGMIKNQVDLANQYSSKQASQRADEEQPGLMMTDRVAAAPSGGDFPPSFAKVSNNASFGWPDGDSVTILRPKLDPNYGEEFDIPELAGKEGEHGGHIFGFNPSKSLFKTGNEDQAWKLLEYTNKDPEHVVPLCAEIANGIPTYRGLREEVKKQFKPIVKGSKQVFNLRLKAYDKYGPSGQYNSTGAAWDVKGTDSIRWEGICAPLNQAIAGQIKRNDAPQAMEKSIKDVLSNQNN